MDSAAKRREARRRRLLQDPEERLKKIKSLNESTQKRSDNSDSDLNTGKEPPACPLQNQSILQGEDAVLLQSPDKQTQVASTEHSCLRNSGSVSPADSKTLERKKHLQEEKKQTTSWNSTLASDPLSLLPGLLTIQKFFAESQNVNNSSSAKTAVACAIAVVFRLSLELEWLKFFTGESMVMIFLLVYLPWLHFWGLNKVKIESLPGALFFSFRIIQDFAFYLFAFVVTHGLVTVLTGNGITEGDQINKSNLT